MEHKLSLIKMILLLVRASSEAATRSAVHSAFGDGAIVQKVVVCVVKYVQIWSASKRWFAKVDSVVDGNAFICSMYLCLKLRPVGPM